MLRLETGRHRCTRSEAAFGPGQLKDSGAAPEGHLHGKAGEPGPLLCAPSGNWQQRCLLGDEGTPGVGNCVAPGGEVAHERLQVPLLQVLPLASGPSTESRNRACG